MTKIIPPDSFLNQDLSLIIDVRSPREYAESHIVGAQNFPVLSNEEHQQIGTLYRTDSFKAKVLGASFVSQNIAKHLLTLETMVSPKKPFGIHCARGGMRSRAFFMVLEAIGYQVVLLEGGYKAYRNEVLKYLDSFPHHRFVTLVGQTGSGKSEIIQGFRDSLDIEGIAKHLGSSFGAICGEQPSVKSFQNLLFTRLRDLENAPFVLVEGESKKLGNLILPTPLYQAYQEAPKILIVAPLEQRVQRIVAQYGKISLSFFENSMQKIAPFMKKEFWQEAKEAFYNRDLARVAEILLVEYYDKVYKKESYLCTIFYQNLSQVTLEIEAFAREFYKLKSKELFG